MLCFRRIDTHFPCSLYLLQSPQFPKSMGQQKYRRRCEFAGVGVVPRIRRISYLCNFCVKGAVVLLERGSMGCTAVHGEYGYGTKAVVFAPKEQHGIWGRYS